MTLGNMLNDGRDEFFTCYVCGKPAEAVLNLYVTQEGVQRNNMPFWCCEEHCDLMESKQDGVIDTTFFEETQDYYV